MKLFLILIFAFITSHADFLNYKNNHCIYNLTPKQNDTGWCFTDRNTDHDRCDRRLKYDRLIDGYVLDDDGHCVLEENLNSTGLTASQWRFQMALMANLVGFTVLFLVSFLSILVTRK